jgi:hypothetical protein
MRLLIALRMCMDVGVSQGVGVEVCSKSGPQKAGGPASPQKCLVPRTHAGHGLGAAHGFGPTFLSPRCSPRHAAAKSSSYFAKKSWLPLDDDDGGGEVFRVGDRAPKVHEFALAPLVSATSFCLAQTAALRLVEASSGREEARSKVGRSGRLVATSCDRSDRGYLSRTPSSIF